MHRFKVDSIDLGLRRLKRIALIKLIKKKFPNDNVGYFKLSKKTRAYFEKSRHGVAYSN